MKNILFVLVSALVVACGSNQGSSVNSCVDTRTEFNGLRLNGLWVMSEGTNYNALTFRDDCSGELQGGGTLSAQYTTFTYSKPSAGVLRIRVLTTTGGYSHPPTVGTYDCAYSDSSNQLVFDCGAGPHTYRP